MILYAGTTESKARRAIELGLSREFPATVDPEQAAELARWKGEERREGGVVLELELDERDLRPDWEMYQAPVRPVLDAWGAADIDEWRRWIEEGRIPIPRGPTDWETSLDVVGWVTHIGIVWPEDVKIRERVR